MFSALVLYILDLYMPCVCCTHKTYTHTHLYMCKRTNQTAESQLDRDLSVFWFFSSKSKRRKSPLFILLHMLHMALKKGLSLRRTIHREHSYPLMLDYCSVIHGTEADYRLGGEQGCCSLHKGNSWVLTGLHITDVHRGNSRVLMALHITDVCRGNSWVLTALHITDVYSILLKLFQPCLRSWVIVAFDVTQMHPRRKADSRHVLTHRQMSLSQIVASNVNICWHFLRSGR